MPDPKKGKRLMATFRPQTWVNDEAVEIAGKFEFDATAPFLNLPIAEINNFKTNNYDTDNLSCGHPLREEHDGPFEVDVEVDEWLEANGVPDRQLMEQEDLNRLRKEYGVRLATLQDCESYWKNHSASPLGKEFFKLWAGEKAGDQDWVYYRIVRWNPHQEPDDPTMPQGYYELVPSWLDLAKQFGVGAPEPIEQYPGRPPTMTRAERDEYHGLYWEEVGKIVDGVESEILDGNIADQDEARQWLEESIEMSDWVTESETWCIHTLLFSQNACGAFFNYEQSPTWLRDLFHVDGDPPTMRASNYAAGDKFPFEEFALVAMRMDAAYKLQQTQAFKDLP